MWRSGIPFLLLAGVIGLVMPWRAAVFRNECAVQVAGQAVAQAQPNHYPLPKLWEQPPCSRHLEGWLGGRIALASGDAQMANNLLRAEQTQNPTNPLWIADTLVAMSEAEKYHAAITLFNQTEDNPAHMLPRVREAVALAFINIGEWDKAHALLPEHIVPLYWQWQETGDTAVYATLQDVTVARVTAADHRLATATLDLLPELVAQGIWSAELAVQVADFLAWQHGLARISTIAQQKPTGLRPIDQVNESRLGTNLLPHSPFLGVQGGRPEGWQFSNYVAPPDDDRFFAGLDGSAVWLMGLGEVRPISGFMALVGQPSEGIGSYFLTLEPEQPYYISGWYATATQGEVASIYVGSASAVALDKPLPATGGEWQWISFSTCGLPSGSGRAQMLFRLESIGSLWVADWAIQPELATFQPCSPIDEQ